MTSLNQNILEMVRKSPGHLTAEEAFLLAKKKKIDVSIASIYRILGKLADDGYIKRFSVFGGPDIFDKTLEEHGHFVCKKCGKVRDIVIPNLKNKIIKESNIEIKDYDLTINYTCEHCRKKEERK